MQRDWFAKVLSPVLPGRHKNRFQGDKPPMTTGFTRVSTTYVQEISSQADIYVHDRTGARILSVKNDDENKVFGISFRTPPSDSTGVAHILEHSVLCGSRKYPVKEPFVDLLKGSLQTFLNAMTYPDKTCYPVASQNLKDFHNLVDVYLDAVFFRASRPKSSSRKAGIWTCPHQGANWPSRASYIMK